MFCCLVCGQEYVSVAALDAHIETVHDKHTCRICTGDYEDQDDCDRIDGVESSVARRSDHVRYSRDELKTHVRDHHDIHISECRRCDRRLFYGDANIARHNTVVHR